MTPILFVIACDIRPRLQVIDPTDSYGNSSDDVNKKTRDSAGCKKIQYYSKNREASGSIGFARVPIALLGFGLFALASMFFVVRLSNFLHWLNSE